MIGNNKSKENSFIHDKSNISNPNKDYFGTQDSSKNDSNLKNEFDKIYTSSLNDFFFFFHDIMQDSYKN